MKYRKKLSVVEAHQWFHHGDHSRVVTIPKTQEIRASRREKLGWLPTPEGGHTVFPGDWVIVDKKGRTSTCNPITFARLYEPHEEKSILPMPGQFDKSA